MNYITIHGIIKDITLSHYIQDVPYYKANILVRRPDNKEDIIPIKFKQFANTFNEGDTISIIGKLRTYSTQLPDKNHVELYVFTYLDHPSISIEDFDTNIDKYANFVSLDGNICKKGNLRKTQKGSDVIDFILANNVEAAGQKFNSYIPMVAWGKQAKVIANKNVGEYLKCEGHFVSRAYKKKLSDSDFEFKIAYEVNIDKIGE